MDLIEHYMTRTIFFLFLLREKKNYSIFSIADCALCESRVFDRALCNGNFFEFAHGTVCVCVCLVRYPSVCVSVRIPELSTCVGVDCGVCARVFRGTCILF